MLSWYHVSHAHTVCGTRQDEDMEACRSARASGQLACEWQPDGGKNISKKDGSVVYVPKCGLPSIGKEDCAIRCGPPPEPGCSAATNWWDLFEDTG